MSVIRPLRRVRPGIWESKDQQWLFLRHESDPAPKRWFVYKDDDDEPYWAAGHRSLRAAVDRVRGELHELTF